MVVVMVIAANPAGDDWVLVAVLYVYLFTTSVMNVAQYTIKN